MTDDDPTEDDLLSIIEQIHTPSDAMKCVTVEYIDEDDPDAGVVGKNAQGAPVVWMATSEYLGLKKGLKGESTRHTEDCRWLEYGECSCVGKPEGEGCG